MSMLLDLFLLSRQTHKPCVLAKYPYNAKCRSLFLPLARVCALFFLLGILPFRVLVNNSVSSQSAKRVVVSIKYVEGISDYG